MSVVKCQMEDGCPFNGDGEFRLADGSPERYCRKCARFLDNVRVDCEECGESFDTDVDDEPYECGECGQAFARDQIREQARRY